MARPRTPIGTFGHIKVSPIVEKTKDEPAVFEARARFRMRNGRFRRLRRRGPSEKAAERALKKAMGALADEVAGRAISGGTRFTRVIELWLEDFEAKVERGDRAPKSFYDYRDTANNYLKKHMGELACREITAGLCDEVLKRIRDQVGYAAAKRAKVVMSGVCGYAVRHEAMDANPAKSVEALGQGEKKPIRALEPAQRKDFLDKLTAWVGEQAGDDAHRLGPRAQAWTDLPDIVQAMLATGTRIGEILAVTGDDVDPVNRTVVVSHHLVRVAGQGIVRVPLRKGRGDALTLSVPSWSVEVWRRRKLESGGGGLFLTWNGQWVDPSNVTKRIRKASDAIGYDWVKSHIFRHTVATHLGDGDINDEAIADQLGNTREVVERHYRRKRRANENVSASLESLMGEG
jgi:integrase